MTVAQHPGQIGFHIDEIWAFISVGPDGEEGVCAVQMGDTMMPLIAADETRLADLRPFAEVLAAIDGSPITLARFGHRVDLETIEP